MLAIPHFGLLFERAFIRGRANIRRFTVFDFRTLGLWSNFAERHQGIYDELRVYNSPNMSVSLQSVTDYVNSQNEFEPNIVEP